jgi:hypothetical protein
MNRRTFLAASGAAVIARAATSSTTVLYGDRAVTLDQVRPDPKDLWVRKPDLPRINDFEVKPQGACRADLCVPIPKDMARGEWFNLSAFARKMNETVVADTDARAWSFGEIPTLSGSYLNSRMAPDFVAPDRKGRAVHLTDFRGKKALVITWASW